MYYLESAPDEATVKKDCCISTACEKGTHARDTIIFNAATPCLLSYRAGSTMALRRPVKCCLLDRSTKYVLQLAGYLFYRGRQHCGPAQACQVLPAVFHEEDDARMLCKT